MRQLPKAVPELDGGLFLPRPVAELLEAVLLEDEVLLRAAGPTTPAAQAPDRAMRLVVLGELRHVLRMTGLRLRLPPSTELLGLDDPQAQARARNLLKG
jgi:hypothetical protein